MAPRFGGGHLRGHDDDGDHPQRIVIDVPDVADSMRHEFPLSGAWDDQRLRVP